MAAVASDCIIHVLTVLCLYAYLGVGALPS